MQCHTASVHYFKLTKCNFYSSWTSYYSLIEYYMCHFYGYDSVKWSIKVDIQRNCSYFINSMNLLVIIHVFDKYNTPYTSFNEKIRCMCLFYGYNFLILLCYKFPISSLKQV